MPAHKGWIDVDICKLILTKDIRVLVPVDGSENSMTALTYVTEGILQADKTAFVEVLHVFDDTKTYLPHRCQKGPLMMTCEAQLTGSISSTRGALKWVERKRPGNTWHQLCQAICELPANYVCMGFYGLKGKKEEQVDLMGEKLSSNVFNVLNQGNSCGVICIKDESVDQLPLKERKATWVVSVNMSKSSTKAFLDVVRLSKPGDDIHVVYITSLARAEGSEYTEQVRAKYEDFCSCFRDADAQDEVFARFGDRSVHFQLVPMEGDEKSPAEAVVRYADSVNADFVAVGANAAERVARGKRPVGTESLRICMLTQRNFIVSNWIDVSARVYEDVARRALEPQ